MTLDTINTSIIPQNDLHGQMKLRYFHVGFVEIDDISMPSKILSVEMNENVGDGEVGGWEFHAFTLSHRFSFRIHF